MQKISPRKNSSTFRQEPLEQGRAVGFFYVMRVLEMPPLNFFFLKIALHGDKKENTKHTNINFILKI